MDFGKKKLSDFGKKNSVILAKNSVRRRFFPLATSRKVVKKKPVLHTNKKESLLTC